MHDMAAHRDGRRSFSNLHRLGGLDRHGGDGMAPAASSLRDLRVAEVTKMDMKVDNGKVTAFRTRVALSFKYEAD
jgi:flavin-binding protein dodecin